MLSQTVHPQNYRTMKQHHLTADQVRIITFEKHHTEDFKRLNFEWIEKYFEIEAHDIDMHKDPYTSIIKPGGQIFMASVEEEIVGTVGLVNTDEETFELIKMAVSSKYQGLRIGRQLMDAAIDYARKAGKRSVVLESNTSLVAALNLYINSGFKIIPMAENPTYNRVNVRMELKLTH